MIDYFGVRHGDYNRRSGRLTDDGILQAKKAGEALVGLTNGTNQLGIITSSRLRAVQTAGLIAETLGRAPADVVESNELASVGENHCLVGVSLQEFLDELVNKNFSGLDPMGRRAIILVTHQPFATAMKTNGAWMSAPPDSDAYYGEVVRAQPNLWNLRD